MIQWLRRLLNGETSRPTDDEAAEDARLRAEIQQRQHAQANKLHVLEYLDWEADVQGRRKPRDQQ